VYPQAGIAAPHPLTRVEENRLLHGYEQRVKGGFADIVPVLKDLSARQHEADFESWAQVECRRRLGFDLPERVLADAWVDQLDLRALFAHATFETFRLLSGDYFEQDPLDCRNRAEAFREFLLECGFHAMNVTPCSDGRLAHAISYVLRLPMRAVRRKSYAGAMFDVEEAVKRWADVELGRFREGVPNLADAPTRYLKVVTYHHSSVDPDHQGCAAHGSDTEQAARAGLEQLYAFREAVENSYCCGASIDVMLLGLDTDTDTLRIHLPDAHGQIALDRYVDAGVVYQATIGLDATSARAALARRISAATPPDAPCSDGMLRLATRLLEHNLSQIDYVRAYHGGHYPDAGHEERFIGVGMDFEEIHLRNLTYFAFMRTVEEGAPNLDVGIKIFKRLHVERGLPIPIVVRFEYPGEVPGARERAVERCARVAGAIEQRYPDLAERGLLHTYWTVRDSSGDRPVECVGASLPGCVGVQA
jgi:carboxysome shell carbonic anhydrase